VATSEAALLALAESIADGAVIDWTAADTLTSAEHQAIVRQLRIVAELATLHRTMPADPAETPPPQVARRSASAPAIGRWAHLELIERLGAGTFGEVYRAWDPHLEREVALKLLRADQTPDDLQSSRIVAEGRLLARLHHPNIVTVHGVALHDGRVGLWMELVEGATLEQLLAQNGSFSAGEAAIIGIDLCRALAAMHQAGLVHRDIKTQNVVREAGGRIVLMDLGTGRVIDRLRPNLIPDLAGTPLYLAPEIFDGAAADERTDLYSLGVLLYRLVTAAFPVRAATIDELCAAHAQKRAVRLRDARPDLPTVFVRVVDRAIAAPASERYRTAGELEADLVSALDHPHTGARAASAGGGSRRRRLTWSGVAIAAAVILSALASPWSPLRIGRRASLDPHAIRSIAVLPLVNLSGDPSQDYFADGMTEAVIDNLARVRALRVISRTSVMQFKGTKKSLREVAAALNVDGVLEGSVVRSGDRVRISADLVHVATDRHVWVDNYDRDVRDLLSLQAEVAQSVAREIQVELTPQERAGFGSIQSANAAVQDAYLQGRYYWNKGTDEGYEKALDYFRQAAALDSTFARAYAGQADVYNMLPRRMSPFTAYPLAKDAANRALAIDPTLADAHTSIAFATFIFDRDWKTAETAFVRALQLNPNYSTAHMWYGDFLVAMGRFPEAERHYQTAEQLDPLAPRIRATHGDAFYFQRRYDEAIRQFRTSLNVGDGDPAAFINLTASYALKGMFTEAGSALAEWRANRGATLNQRAMSGLVLAMKGDRAAATKVMEDLVSTGSAIDVSANLMAAPYIYLGRRDRAFELLDRAERARAPGLLWANVDPMFDPLRSDPRFTDLLRRLHLAP
jgi:eukaryotic-like serine/threonine-protein kinase